MLQVGRRSELGRGAGPHHAAAFDHGVAVSDAGRAATFLSITRIDWPAALSRVRHCQTSDGPAAQALRSPRRTAGAGDSSSARARSQASAARRRRVASPFGPPARFETRKQSAHPVERPGIGHGPRLAAVASRFLPRVERSRRPGGPQGRGRGQAAKSGRTADAGSSCPAEARACPRRRVSPRIVRIVDRLTHAVAPSNEAGSPCGGAEARSVPNRACARA